ncbi:MAG: fimbrial biogenesis outer membrane usher protein [Deltaproteobacteria bacterium]|nr:fimbrial biogenesis outer membrane usher protein [Deltaproteobacteria bacterium]
MVLRVTVNQMPKGDFFVLAAPAGDFLIRTEDLLAMGFRDPKGETSIIGKEEYISLKSMQGVRFTFREDKLALDILASPKLLPKRTVDYSPQRPRSVQQAGADTSAFLNYRLDFAADEANTVRGFALTNELGVRAFDMLFINDSAYTRTGTNENFVRLETNMTYDFRSSMERFTFGDFFASAGELAGNLNMAGASFSKVYRIDPYFIRPPMFGFTGLAAMASDVEIYINGMLVKKDRFQPGEFELKNISSYQGAGDVEVVLRDPFGKEERVQSPFYFTDTVLREGLSEYSYNMGFLRENFGAESNDYGGAAFSLFHLWGLTNSVTAGVWAEGGGGIYAAGPRMSYINGSLGVFSLALGVSEDSSGEDGYAAFFSHRYQSSRFGAMVTAKKQTMDFSTIGLLLSPERPDYDAGAGVSYGSKTTGTIAFDYTISRQYTGLKRKAAGLSYSRGVFKNATAFAALKNVQDNSNNNFELFVGITYYPGRDLYASSSWRLDKNGDTELVQVQKNAPAGQGLGYRASYTRDDSLADTVETLNPYLQYNGRYGIYTAEYRMRRSGMTSGWDGSYELTASGGFAYVAGAVAASRPVADSFGLVMVPGLAGVRVYNNNQEMDRTDSEGNAFIPVMSSYYDNRVSVDGKDIPLNYSLKEAAKSVSPALRSGSVIIFDAIRIQGITGNLLMRIEGKAAPAELLEFRMETDGANITFPTGRGGEFYLENMEPGAYTAFAEYEGKTYSFRMNVPESNDIIIDLGGIYGEVLR